MHKCDYGQFIFILANQLSFDEINLFSMKIGDSILLSFGIELSEVEWNEMGWHGMGSDGRGRQAHGAQSRFGVI